MENRELRLIFQRAQGGNNDAIQKILEIFQPLVLKHSVENGSINEDYFQELSIKLLNCIQTFEFAPDKNPIEDIHKIYSSLRK